MARQPPEDFSYAYKVVFEPAEATAAPALLEGHPAAVAPVAPVAPIAPMGDVSYTGSGGVRGVGDCARLTRTLGDPGETLGPQIDRIPSTRPPWWHRQYRELKKLTFRPPVRAPLISLDH